MPEHIVHPLTCCMLLQCNITRGSRLHVLQAAAVFLAWCISFFCCLLHPMCKQLLCQDRADGGIVFLCEQLQVCQLCIFSSGLCGLQHLLANKVVSECNFLSLHMSRVCHWDPQLCFTASCPLLDERVWTQQVLWDARASIPVVVYGCSPCSMYSCAHISCCVFPQHVSTGSVQDHHVLLLSHGL